MSIGVIGGTGFYSPAFLEEPRREVISTPYGEAALYCGRQGRHEVFFLPRHGEDHLLPPHRVNYRANLWALREAGVERVLALAAAGSLSRRIRPGDLVTLDQFIDFTRARPFTFFEGGSAGVLHVDLTEPYCPEIRAAFLEAASSLGLRAHPGGCYVCTEGPRFETPAEIKMFRRLGGDVVGMTNVPEVVLAREAGLCYGAVVLVSNYAAGLSRTPPSHQEVVAMVRERGPLVQHLLLQAMELLPATSRCTCRSSSGRPHNAGQQ